MSHDSDRDLSNLYRAGACEGLKCLDRGVEEARAALVHAGDMGAKVFGRQVQGGGQKAGFGLVAGGHGDHRGDEFRRYIRALAADGDGNQARLLLQRDQGFEITTVGLFGQKDGAADGGVAGEGDFGGGEEDADFRGMGGVGGGLDEDGFRQVELPRDGLHLRGGEVFGAQNNRERIAREGGCGEDVQGMECNHFMAL